MTTYSNVKSCLASLKSAESGFSQLAQLTTNNEACKIFHEGMVELEEIIADLRQRIAFMEREEPQYSGN